MSKHAILSPSSSDRWIHCPPSALLEASLKVEGEGESESSEAAKVGTIAHALCEYKLKKALGKQAEKPISEFIDKEMEEYTDGYVEFVLEKYEEAKKECPDAEISIEQYVEFDGFVPDGFGTADCIIVFEGKLHIIDFKYGLGHLVEVNDNSQLKCYAIGAMALFDPLYTIKEVTMSIYQPRRSNVASITVDGDELIKWAHTVLKPSANLAIKGEGKFHAGPWCKFCRAKTLCRERAKYALKAIESDLKKPPLLSDEEVNDFLPFLDIVDSWLKGIRDYTLSKSVNQGYKWGGFKLVEGRSYRKFFDENKVAEICESNGYKDIYETSLKPLTELEKLIGKKDFERLLGNQVYKPLGKPTLVPESDKRVAMNIIDVENEFKKEID